MNKYDSAYMLNTEDEKYLVYWEGQIVGFLYDKKAKISPDLKIDGK